MSYLLARIISYILNPLVLFFFMPILLVYKFSRDLNITLHWTAYTAVFILALTICIIYGVRKKIFTDLDVSRQSQRPLLFLIGIIFAIVYLAGLFLLHGPLILILVIFVAILGIFLASILNTYLKTSLHVMTIAFLVVTMAIVYGRWYYLCLLSVPLVAWARIRIKRHTLPETVVGAILGSLLSLVMYGVVSVFLSI